MNYSALSTLVAIIDRGSFAAAAEEVGCTPSAVSLQMKQLETFFGQPLFDRSARTVKTTPLAREAAAVAREFTQRFANLRARSAMAVAGRVRLGAIASFHTGVLPLALRVLRERHPALEVDIFPNDSDALQAELKAGRIDMAVMVRPQSGGSTRLAWLDLSRQPYVMLVPPTARGTSPKELLQRHDLIRYDLALTGGRIASRHVRKLVPKVRCVMEVRAIDTIVAMVSAGHGVSVVPQPRKTLLDAYGVRVVSLGKSGPTRQIAIARRSADSDNRNLDAVAKAIILASRNDTGNEE